MTGQHYFVERNDQGRYAVRVQGSRHASSLFERQSEAVAEVERLNKADHPNAERVRSTGSGPDPGPDKWRAA